MNDQSNENVYERVGGLQWFDELCSRFYERVATDEVLRPLYPEDLEPSRYWLALFLAQYWGGPGDYSTTRGTQDYECSHAHLRVGVVERDRWYHHMAEAVSESQSTLIYKSKCSHISQWRLLTSLTPPIK